MGQEKYPKAAKMIKENTYMEDTIESVSVWEETKKLVKEIENFLDEGSIKIEEWIYTLDSTDQTKILSVPGENIGNNRKSSWNCLEWSSEDDFEYKVHIKMAASKKKIRIPANAEESNEKNNLVTS